MVVLTYMVFPLFENKYKLIWLLLIYILVYIDNYSDERGAILSKPSVNKRQDQIGSISSASIHICNMYAHKGRTNISFVQRAKHSDGFVFYKRPSCVLVHLVSQFSLEEKIQRMINSLTYGCNNCYKFKYLSSKIYQNTAHYQNHHLFFLSKICKPLLIRPITL